jgi:hypothetical protein
MVGPGQPDPFGQGDLVVDPIARSEHAVADGLFDLLCHLEIQRDWAGPVEMYDQLGHRRLPGGYPTHTTVIGSQ